jgi:hypothetical protein
MTDSTKPKRPPSEGLVVMYSHREVLERTTPIFAKILQDLDSGAVEYTTVLASIRAGIQAVLLLAHCGEDEGVNSALVNAVVKEVVTCLHQALCKENTWSREEYFAQITPEKAEQAGQLIKQVVSEEVEDELKLIAQEKNKVSGEEGCDCPVCQMRKAVAAGGSQQDFLRTLMAATGADVTIIKMSPDGTAEEVQVVAGETVEDAVKRVVEEDMDKVSVAGIPTDQNQVKH